MATSMNHVEGNDLAYTMENIGAKVIRYGLVVILLVVGALKFTDVYRFF